MVAVASLFGLKNLCHNYSMFTRALSTGDPQVELVKPDIERDALLGVRWLAGADGRQTLRLMGVTDEHNQPTTLDQERKRVGDFLTGRAQYNWMIRSSGQIVGSVWVDLRPTQHIQAPAVSVMIGDYSVRGRGIGRLAVGSVLDYMRRQSYRAVYARFLEDNRASRALFMGLGFMLDGAAYTDEDGLKWQNTVYSMTLDGVGRFLDAQGRLASWPAKVTDKLSVLEYLSTKFAYEKAYSEQEVNQLLKEWHTFHDWPLLRRELFENGFIKRNRDGSNYERVK